MFFQEAYIPYGGYWSTPFSRWQESFAHLNAIPFAAEIAVRALEERNVSPQVFDSLYFGITIPQIHSFYGGPWLAGLMGGSQKRLLSCCYMVPGPLPFLGQES